MAEHTSYTQEQLKEMYEAARASEPIYKDLTFIAVLGGPGTESEMHCRDLASHFGFKHINVAQILLKEAEIPDSPFRLHIRNAYRESYLKVDVDIAFAVLRRHLDVAVIDGHKEFLFEGFPQCLEPLHRFEQTIATFKLVMYMDASDDVIEEWLKHDGQEFNSDGGKWVKARATLSRAQTQPAIDYLRTRATDARMYCHIAVASDHEIIQADLRRAVVDALEK